jgi:MraZ protein
VAFDARKTRLSVPSAFRAVLARTGTGEPDVVLRPSNHSPCIDVWPKAAFEAEVERRLDGLDAFSEEYEAITDELTVRVHETRVDADGRVVLPRTLLAELPLDANAVIVGRKSHFQIWSAPVWADRQAAIKARPKAARTTPMTEGTAA